MCITARSKLYVDVLFDKPSCECNKVVTGIWAKLNDLKFDLKTTEINTTKDLVQV